MAKKKNKQTKKKQRQASTQKVSAGEVCSIATAKRYGFFDKKNYYTPGYSDVKTFNATLDQEQGRDSNAVCKQSSDGTKSFPLCTVVYGIPYTQDPLDPKKCTVNMKDFCPESLRKGNTCTRSNIMMPPPVPMSSHCDERVTDWYMIPNYHLGNKYNFINDGNRTQCMKPCPLDKMPGYTEDPVDGSSAGMMANTEVNKCYNKYEYMNGKYADTGNFCPISWVYRLGQKKEQIVDDILKNIKDKKSSSVYKKMSIEIANQEANSIYQDSKKMLENVEYPTNAMMVACSKFHTPSKVKKAYNICKQIHHNPKIAKTLLSSPAQQKVLTKSCHVLFCNKADDLVSTISSTTRPLCFKGMEDINGKEILKNDMDIDSANNMDAVIGSAPTYKEEKTLDRSISKFKKYVIIAAIVLLVSVLSILIILAWPYIKRFLRMLMCYIPYIIRMAVPEYLYEKKIANERLVECIKNIPPIPKSNG